MIIFPTAIISQFTNGDTELISVGQKALRANGLSFMLFGFCTVYSSLFLALGRAKEGCFLGVCRQGICFIPVILIAPMLWGIDYCKIILTQKIKSPFVMIATLATLS